MVALWLVTVTVLSRLPLTFWWRERQFASSFGSPGGGGRLTRAWGWRSWGMGTSRAAIATG